MLPGCHSVMHVMVCEHSTDRLIAVSSRAPAQLPMLGMPSRGGSSSAPEALGCCRLQGPHRRDRVTDTKARAM